MFPDNKCNTFDDDFFRPKMFAHNWPWALKYSRVVLALKGTWSNYINCSSLETKDISVRLREDRKEMTLKKWRDNWERTNLWTIKLGRMIKLRTKVQTVTEERSINGTWINYLNRRESLSRNEQFFLPL